MNPVRCSSPGFVPHDGVPSGGIFLYFTCSLQAEQDIAANAARPTRGAPA